MEQKGSIWEQARDDFAIFLYLVYPHIEHAWHTMIIADCLNRTVTGEITNLMISMPPGHGKSTVASEAFVAWYLGRNPSHLVLALAYGLDLVQKFGNSIRNIIMSADYQRVFPEISLSKTTRGKTNFIIDPYGGGYKASGFGGAVTGRRANVLLIDDAVKGMADVNSKEQRENLKTIYTTSVQTRVLRNPLEIVIGTRWHDDDLIGWLQRAHAYKPWKILELEAIATEDEPFRKKGEALWESGPAPLEVLLHYKFGMSPFEWAALYQQKPIPADGSIFKAEFWQKYRLADLYDQNGHFKARFDFVGQFWDTAHGETQLLGRTSDRSACVTIGWIEGRGYFVLDIWYGRPTFPQLLDQIMVQYNKWRPNAVVIEQAANAIPAWHMLKKQAIPLTLQVTGVKDKILKANMITGILAAHLVWVPEDATFTEEFYRELHSFPRGANDDIVDSFVMGIGYLSKKANNILETRGGNSFNYNYLHGC